MVGAIFASPGVCFGQADVVVIHTFTVTEGASPNGLIQGLDGQLYGTTMLGGAGCADCGTIFSMAPDGSGFVVLHQFVGTDGSSPAASLLQGVDGTLYGTTMYGGPGGNGPGIVFAIQPDGSGFVVLHQFVAYDGGVPVAPLIQGTDGLLYGVASIGGLFGFGTVFRLAQDGSNFSVVHDVDPYQGYEPFGGLLQGRNGLLYGTTRRGVSPSNYEGTVFRVAPDGSGFAVLHGFLGVQSDGVYPVTALIQDAAGTLYGTTGNTVFQLAADGSGYGTVRMFIAGGQDGSGPLGQLVLGTDGMLYGTTLYGGGTGCPDPNPAGCGTIFTLAPDGSGFRNLYVATEETV
jgi:uncharacterized repeat protein (TIGR03803 family)